MARTTLITVICAALLAGGCSCDGGQTDGSDDIGTDVMDAVDVPTDLDDIGADADDVEVGIDGEDADQAGTASVTTLVDGQPAASTRVLVHRADGTLRDDLTTNTGGEVEFDVSSGTMVTIVRPDALPAHEIDYVTVVDVQPGDSVLYTKQSSSPSEVGEVNIDFPGSFGETTEASASIGCRSADSVSVSETLTLAITEECPQNGDEFDVLARIGGDDNPLAAYASRSNVERDPALDNNIEFQDWNTNLQGYDLSISGFPQTGEISAWLTLFVDGQTFESGNRIERSAGDQPLDFAMGYPPGFAGATNHIVQYQRTESSKVFQRGAGFRDEGAASDKSFSVTPGDMLPPLTSVSATDTAQARPSVNWSVDSSREGELSSADATVVRFTWQDGDREWQAVMPGDRRSFEFPELAGGLDDPTQGGPTATVVAVFDYEQYEDFDAVRSQPPTNRTPGFDLFERTNPTYTAAAIP